MKTNQITTTPEYLHWLHELTVAGYEQNIIILSDHADAVLAIYALKGDNGIDYCLKHYQNFCRRWSALGGKTNLTFPEAIALMNLGKKITHRFFTANEWMTIENGKILTEEGYRHDLKDFFSYRAGENWLTGYSVID